LKRTKLEYETVVGKIPAEWEIVSLKEVHNGKNKLINPHSFPSETFELYSIPAYFETHTPELRTGESIKSIKFLVEQNTILFGKINPRNPKVWKIVSKNKSRKIASTEFMPIFPNKDSSFDFIYQILASDSFIEKSKTLVSGTTPSRARIEPKRFYDLIIPYPPLREQQKIASILSEVDELIQKTNKIIEQTQRLKKGLMQRLLTKGIGHVKFRRVKMDSNLHETYPLEWDISCLSDLCNIERGKFAHRPRGDPAYYGGDYPFIQTGDIEKSDGNIVSFSQTLNDSGLAVSKLFPQGIIVITIAGSNIGRTGITTFPVCFPDSVIGISTDKLNIKYLEHYLRTRRNLLQTKATVSGQPNINLETLKPLLVPVPSLREQDKIVDIISSLDSQISLNKRMKTSLNYLKKALLQQLLTGKIRVKI